MELDDRFWEERYRTGQIGWDIGAPSTPLKEYIDQLEDKTVRILIPGGGHAYEAEYAHRLGSRNVFVIDLTDAPFKELLERCPDFPVDHLIVGDFFAHEGKYDLILEQTFFCALDPALRERYVQHMYHLLNPGGSLVGVLFDDPLNTDQPPFGGSKTIYEPLFRKHFKDLSMEPCSNSIGPRNGRELWLHATKASDYEPIDCNVYDHYEAAATLERNARFTLADGSTVTGIIGDLFIRDGAEWMRLKEGREIRLDQITDMTFAQFRS